jgi:hypothetical protein
VKRDSFGQSRHRDLLKTKTKAIEPVLDADGSDRKVANMGPSISFALAFYEAM